MTPRKTTSTRRLRAAMTVVMALAVVGTLGIVAVRRSDGGARPMATTTLPGPAPRSLAVLPFVNMSPDPANGYFSDGLSEQIISALSRITRLRVAARTSSFALRDAKLDVRAIGDTLGVDAVLEGSVRREGDRVRVMAKLIDAETGYQVWTGEYERDATGAITVQDEIAAAIAGALELRLPVRVTAAARTPPPRLEAYDLYLRALYLRNELNVDALRQADALLDSAIAREPAFGLAYAAKASVVAPRMYFGHVPLPEGTRAMRAAVSRAFALDSALGEAHVALGILQLFFEWDWNGAERSLRRALELNPSDAHAWHHLANHLHAVGRLTEALEARLQGVALDPLNARTRIVLATDLVRVGRADDALAEVERAQSLDPMNPLLLGLGPTLPVIARVQHARGRSADALQGLMRIAALRDAAPADIERLRQGFARGGVAALWREWLALDLRLSGGTINPVRAALMHAAAGDTVQALDKLDRAFAARDPGLIYLNGDPIFDALQGHPRFQRIVAAMRLPRP